MTERSRNDPRLIAAVLLLLFGLTVALIIQDTLKNMSSTEERKSCMEKLVEPDPEASDYNDQVLYYGSDVRTCMRG